MTEENNQPTQSLGSNYSMYHEGFTDGHQVIVSGQPVEENIIRNQGALMLIAEELRHAMNNLSMRVYLVVEEKESLEKRLTAMEKMIGEVRTDGN